VSGGIIGVMARWRGIRKRPAEAVALTPARRGQIVQRVIVDGWTCAEAATAAGVSERLVDAWVADYRRNGMASLRHVPRRTVAGGILRLWPGRPVRSVSRAIADGLRRLFGGKRPTGAASPDRSNDDRRGGGT
jgi:Homeodomain-like domain